LPPFVFLTALECTKFVFPRWGSSALPDLAGLKGTLLLRGAEGMEGRRGEGKGEETMDSALLLVATEFPVAETDRLSLLASHHSVQ